MAANVTTVSRFSLALLFAATATLALAYFMQWLIQSDDAPYQAAKPSPPITWYRLLEEVVIEDPPPTFQKPPVEREPDMPPPERFNPESGGPLQYAVLRPMNNPGPMGPRTGHADGDLLPIVAIAPEYPQRAKSRGIEGYVTLKFTVNTRGRVENAVVVEAVPTGIFDRAALRAISRFRYRPRVVNGEPLPVEGVTTRLRFNLEG